MEIKYMVLITFILLTLVLAFFLLYIDKNFGDASSLIKVVFGK